MEQLHLPCEIAMLNATDLKILAILLKDARTPHAQIAEEIGLSRPAIAERIKKLEQAGVIKGYSAVINPEAVGKAVTAFISAKYPGVIDAAVIDALKDLVHHTDILEIHSIAGEDCFLIKVRTDNMQTLNQIINFLKEPPLTMTTKTTIVLERYFEKNGHVQI